MMPETIGQILKREREQRNLTITQVVTATKIRARYLELIEADGLEELPSRQSQRGFVRIYSDYLGINLDSIIALNVHKEESEKGSLDSQERNINIVEMVSNSTNPEDSQEDDYQIRAEDSNRPSSNVITTQSSQAKAIFISVGEKLRQQREKLGFSFDEVERHTHVKKHYLEALEAGELGNLPSPVQARGMLNNYAHFLNLNTDAFLALFADGLQALHRENHPVPNSQIVKKGDTHTVSKILAPLISFDVIFGGSLIILLVVFAVWGTFHVISRQNPTQLSTAESISDALLETPLPDANIRVQPGTATGTSMLPIMYRSLDTVPTAPEGRVQVVVMVILRTWLRVSVDNAIEYEGRVTPGTFLTFGGDQQIEVVSSNGAAVQIIHNQSNLGVMGNFGEIADHTYTESGIIIPTSTMIPNPTSTITPTTEP